MSGAQLNKSELLRTKRSLSAYRALAPALDLKRKSLLVLRAQEAKALSAARERHAAIVRQVGAQAPMLAHEGVAAETRVTHAKADITEEVRLGARLPRLDGVNFETQPVPGHVFPHWVEAAVALVQEAVRADVAARVAGARLAALDKALAKVTQRVNLLEKVLIPRAQARIREIEIRLSDLDRAAVVIAKIAKARLQPQGAAR
jgi:V/A-type H+-transporting ATPase subunit D